MSYPSDSIDSIDSFKIISVALNVYNFGLELKYNKIPFQRRIARPNRLRNRRETEWNKKWIFFL